MTRKLTGYLAGTAFVLAMAGAAGAYAQTARQAQDQATADSHAGQPADADRGERDRERAERANERVNEQAERQREHADEQRERLERHIVMRHGEDAAGRLRTLLQLRPGQDAALQAYVAAIHPARPSEHIVEMSDHAAPRTTTQKLADMERRLTEQGAQAKARIDATRTFYAQLDPAQKKVFDELPLPGPMMILPGMGPMRVMVNLDGPPRMDRMPPLPPLPPRPPAPPAPPRFDD